MITAKTLLIVCALSGGAAKGSDTSRALAEQDSVRARPVVMALPATVVVTREEDIVIEAVEPQRAVAVRDEWRGESLPTRVRASWWQRAVRVIEAM